jgi:hypothetical protein
MSIQEGAAPHSPAADENKVITHDWDDLEYDDDGNLIQADTTTPIQPNTNELPEGQQAPGTTPESSSPAAQSNPENPAVSAGELLLRRNGFETNIIQYGDEEVDFSTLSPEEQADVLGQLYEQEQQDLSEDARYFDQLLKSGLTPQQVAEYLLQGGAELSDDELHLEDIRKGYPNLSEQEQLEELEDRKAGRLYAAKTEQLRQQAEASRPTLEQLQAREQEATAAEMEAVARSYVHAAAEVQDVDGFPVTDEVRNFLLGDMVELEQNGQSRMVNLFEDPKQMFRLAYYDRFMPQILSSFNEQLASAREQGRQEALQGFPTRPISTDGGASKMQAPAATRRTSEPGYDPMLDSIEDFGG